PLLGDPQRPALAGAARDRCRWRGGVVPPRRRGREFAAGVAGTPAGGRLTQAQGTDVATTAAVACIVDDRVVPRRSGAVVRERCGGIGAVAGAQALRLQRPAVLQV